MKGTYPHTSMSNFPSGTGRSLESLHNSSENAVSVGYPSSLDLRCAFLYSEYFNVRFSSCCAAGYGCVPCMGFDYCVSVLDGLF